MFNYKTRLAWDSLVLGSQRKSISKKILSTVFAIFVAIMASAILVGIMGQNSSDFLVRLFTKWKGSYEVFLSKVAIVGIAALSFIFAFKAGLFNIGISGQMLGAGLIMLLVVKNMTLANINMPNGLGQLFLLIIAMLAGGLFALFIGILKVFLKINEVVSSILMNWIIFYITRYVVFTSQNKLYNPTPNTIGSSSIKFDGHYSLDYIVGGGETQGYGYIFALLIFISLAVIVWVILKYTVFGHKILSVGKSFEAARYAGYKTKIISLSTFAISGILAGALAMVTYTSNTNNSIPISQSNDILPAEGFSGIAIGLISLTHPLATIPVSFLMGMLQQSADNLGGAFSGELSGIIISFIMLGAAMFILFERISPVYWMYEWIYNKKARDYYKDYENKSNQIILEHKARLNEIVKNHKDTKKEINKIFIFLNKNRNAKNYEELLKQTNETQSNLDKYFKTKINNEFALYKNEMMNNKAQFKKHLLIEKTTNIYYPEIKATVAAKNKIKQKENVFAKKLSRLNDKIFADEQVLKLIKNKMLANYSNQLKFDYNEFISLKKELINNNFELNESLELKLNNLFKDEVKLILDEYKVSQDNNLISDFINKKSNQEIDNLLSVLNNNELSKQEQIQQTNEIMSKLDKNYNVILQQQQKHQNEYNKLLNSLESVNESKEQLINKYTKHFKADYNQKHFEKTKVKINNLKLDQNQKELLHEWLLTAYNKTNENNYKSATEVGVNQ